MAEADLKKAVLIPVPLPVDITDDCTRLLGQLCAAGGPIDPRAIRALAFLTDSVDVSGSSVDVTDRCARSLGQLCFGGVPIDPRDRNWDLNFATDQVDASGSSVNATIVGTPDVNVTDRDSRILGEVRISDIPVSVKVLLDQIANATYINEGVGTLRTEPEGGTIDTVTTVSTVSNISGIGSVPANSIVPDLSDIVYGTNVRPQII